MSISIRIVLFLSVQVSERENHPSEANNGTTSASAASEKRKYHDDLEPFKDVKRVSIIDNFSLSLVVVIAHRLDSSRKCPSLPFSTLTFVAMLLLLLL